ncbi:transposase IS200-family protein [Nitrosococcus halophilus Nc 4]|uniref:Transposase IS200-family protein n=1 Tax=Nitrosococcus halophilus (strain Nc4) TaxID=472759 RepID=D5BYK8_NITHN|nr:IS200/IS605 family transposase [Nitrosococcus halophilus]ADE14342.1 transposase IS200-family protein [Nitrosococcus halophilus Nc 4]ADE15996.1 transposase IS200-family protein [Nitrosococcus halophilus Nc 4]
MSVNDDYRRGRHSVTRLLAHLVFTTKYRRKVFDGVMIGQLREAFDSACEKLDCRILEFDGEEDHVHLLVEYPPKLSISVLVNNLKSTSSRRIRFLNTHIPRLSKSAALWSRSYFACSAGGATIKTLKAYVNGQKTPH